MPSIGRVVGFPCCSLLLNITDNRQLRLTDRRA